MERKHRPDRIFFWRGLSGSTKIEFAVPHVARLSSTKLQSIPFRIYMYVENSKKMDGIIHCRI